MAESDDQTPKPEEGNLDLSDLSSMSLGPDWVSGKKPRTQLPNTSREDRPRGPKGPRKDRRGSLPPKRRPERGGHDRGDRPERRGHGHDRGGRHERHERPAQPFRPIVEATFYPEEEPFRVLSQAIKTSCRTFELFEIARLILEKPDRFVCVVRDPEQKEGEEAKLHASVPDGLPFRTEEEALTHTLQHYIDDFFDKETVEVDPPAGSFQLVHKCGFTGEILGPPNYHRYQSMCREHHAAKLAHMPYSRFEQRIETSREEDDIQAWMQKMRTQTHFKSKEDPDLVFKSFEDARLHLVTQAKDKLVRPAYSARFSGKAIALLNPGDPIRRSVESLLDYQKKFPLDTANHLRGRLRRMNFAVYKRGSKGISYVCAVKRRFRKPDEILADNLQELIDFLEAHPNFPAKDLPKGFLGIDPAKKQEKAAAKAAAQDVAQEVETEMTKTEVEGDVPKAEPEIEAKESQEISETAEVKPEAEPENKVERPSEPPEKGEAKEQPLLSDAEQVAIRQLKTDLHYLVSEGYVIEYSDGRLFVPPIREEEIRRVEKQKAEGKEAKPAETAPADAPEASSKPDESAHPEAPQPEPSPEAPKDEGPAPEPVEAAPVEKPEPPVAPAEPAEPESKAEPETESKAEPEPESKQEPEPEAESKPEAEPEPEPEKHSDQPVEEAPSTDETASAEDEASSEEKAKKPDQPGV